MFTGHCVTWTVCWGCWDPTLRSDLESCSHHAVGSEIHSGAYGFLLGGKTSSELEARALCCSQVRTVTSMLMTQS